jgi:hypothetical protein
MKREMSFGRKNVLAIQQHLLAKYMRANQK